MSLRIPGRLKLSLIGSCLTIFVFAFATASAQVSVPIDIEKPPFKYSETEDNNRITRLIENIQSGEIELEKTSDYGYLRSLLNALDIYESSQTLVFSKTSLQVQYITPRNPRALYFNDDTYVGWVRGSSLMEISTDDPKLGAAFYLVDTEPAQPKIERAYYDCLGCHATSMTQGIPGHTVRSVLAGFDGGVDSQRKAYITDHRSPLSQRWGGWYVTGQHGDMEHLGNSFFRVGSTNTGENGNWRSLHGEVNPLDYVSPYSDIVALMVLEHQTQMHNTMTRADFSVRQLLYDQSVSKASPETKEEFNAQIALLATDVVEDLLYCDEAPLTSPIKGSLSFAGQFARRGPKDGEGRSLRQFDLQTRMFKYPCSYMIYSSTFDNLPNQLLAEVVGQLLDILKGRNQSPSYAHLTPTMRSEILEILRQTKPVFRK